MSEASFNFFDEQSDLEIQEFRVKRRIEDAKLAIDGAFLIDLSQDISRYGLTQEQINEYFRAGIEPDYDL